MCVRVQPPWYRCLGCFPIRSHTDSLTPTWSCVVRPCCPRLACANGTEPDLKKHRPHVYKICTSSRTKIKSVVQTPTKWYNGCDWTCGCYAIWVANCDDFQCQAARHHPRSAGVYGSCGIQEHHLFRDS